MTAPVTLVGNLVRDPELKGPKNNIGDLGIAVNRRYMVDGEWQEETSFFDITCFGSLADNVVASLRKGDRVLVQGRLQQDAWKDPTSGENRYKVKVIADAIGPDLRWAEIENIVKNPKKGEGPQMAKAAHEAADKAASTFAEEEPF